MSFNNDNTSTNMPDPTADSQLAEPTTLKPRSASNNKAVVVGLYGIPGAGKSFLLNQLKHELGETDFAFYEGSETIANVVPGGLEAFQKLEEREKLQWRQRAIDTIGKRSAESGKVAVVAGHFMFWSEEEEVGCAVYTQNDLDTFTHILYLDVPAEVVAQHRVNNTQRGRPAASVAHLQKWQQAEKTELRRLCRHHNILFSLVSSHSMLPKVSTLLRDFWHHTEEYNLSQAESKLDEAILAGQDELETVLVMDADRTLTTVDTGKLFWKSVSSSQSLGDRDDPLKALFSSPLGYSYTAFRQAMLLYEEAFSDTEFDSLCEDVASRVTMHPFVSMLKAVAEHGHVNAVIITCGLRRIWEKVLKREGLSMTVKVIGGGRIVDGFIVTAELKGALVARLRSIHQVYVWAFGDSRLDLDMLKEADQAIVVVGEEQTRSKTMDAALKNAIINHGLRARQVLLPSHASPRLDTTKLPLLQLTEPEILESIFCRRSRHTELQVRSATQSAARLLMTPMRNANLAGPVLRDAHQRVGWYLATGLLTDVIGTEEYPIPHVQGGDTHGYRLLHEQKTSIVALMRGGEPMALGISEAFPRAMFVHANCAHDVKLHHVQGQRTVILVDSVVNSGRTVVEFVQRIHKLNATIRILVVAGVVQAGSISGHLAQIRHGNLSLVTLRLSDNRFTGRGTTDTGNRLFNTTHLP